VPGAAFRDSLGIVVPFPAECLCTMAPETKISTAADGIGTVIYVDVDGVLNVALRTECGPLLVSRASIEFADERRYNPFLSQKQRRTVERLTSITRRQRGRAESGTYRDLACEGSSEVSDVLVGRLAGLIRAAGRDCAVILSSSWRHDAKRVRDLECVISRRLGRFFTFHASTRPAAERCAADRLACIGSHIEALFLTGQAGGKPLKVLVLEDFFISPLDGWSCGRSQVSTPRDAEEFLLGCVPQDFQVSVKFVHTYDEWQTPYGLRLQLGTGLSLAHCRMAEAFLAGENYSGSCEILPLHEGCIDQIFARKIIPHIRSQADDWSQKMFAYGWALVSLVVPCHS